jgi:hypothetical protein
MSNYPNDFLCEWSTWDYDLDKSTDYCWCENPNTWFKNAAKIFARCNDQYDKSKTVNTML